MRLAWSERCSGGPRAVSMISAEAIRISPGEPLHEIEASRHYVLNWSAALQADQPITSAAPSNVLPAIGWRLIHQVVLQHVRAWPEWVYSAEPRP
jgi:hypothetical protein